MEARLFRGVVEVVDFNATDVGQRVLDNDTLVRLMEILNHQGALRLDLYSPA